MDIPELKSAVEQMIAVCVPAAVEYQNEVQGIYDWLNACQTDISNKLMTLRKNVTPSPKPNRFKKRALLSSSDDDGSKSQTDVSKICDSISVNNTVTELGKRQASKMASLKINNQSSIKLNTKMRRPDTIDKENQDNCLSFISLPNAIKTEKKSDPEKSNMATLADTTNAMLPPTLKPKRGRKKIKKEIVETSDTETEGSGRMTRSKRTYVKKEKSPSKVLPPSIPPVIVSQRVTRSIIRTRADSDVIIREEAVPLITVADSDDEESTIMPVAIKKVAKEDEEKKKKKGTKKTKTKKDQLTVKPTVELEVSLYEDANTTVVTGNKDLTMTNVVLNCTQVLTKNSPQVNALNSTHVINKDALKEKGISMNCSVVLQKLNDDAQTKSINKTTIIDRIASPVHKSPEKNQTPTLMHPTVNSLLTDDDDSIDIVKTPEKPIKKTLKKKPMFSPCADSPVKKRVAAFEKLGTNDEIGTRVTRTKTRNMAANETKPKEVIRALPRPRFITPSASNKIPSMIPHTDSKMQYGSQQNITSSDVSVKCLTAYKISQAELQERRQEEQKRWLGKENEAARKKEQIMLAKTEEQRRKREEKQARAQKTREALDKEKEDKLRQLLQEKEQKQLDELQKKREWEQTRIAGLEKQRKNEEQSRLRKQKELEAKKKLDEERRARLNVKPPPLPTEDCEDSDSSSENVKPKSLGPLWGQPQQLDKTLKAQWHVPKCYIEKFFKMRAQTPDLREIFDDVDERALRRNSSAVWRTPPRYSTLPKF